MAEFKEAADLMRQNEPAPRGVIHITGALVLSILFSLLMFLPGLGRPDYMVGRYDTTGAGVEQVHYRGEAWQVSGAPVKLDDAALVAIERTDEAYFLYAERERLGGGGGGLGALPEFGAHPSAYGQIYLRTGSGLFQPVSPAR